MTIIGSLAVSLRANTKQYTRGMKKAGRTASTFSSTISRVARVGAVASGLMLTAAATATAALVKSQFTAIDAIAKTSDRINIQTEKLIGLQHAAQITGVANEVFNKSLEKMLDSTSKASQGLSTQIKAFDELGLKADDLKLLTADEQFKTIADAMGNVTNATDKMRIARDIFGRGGAALVNTLALGSKGINKLQTEAEKMGLTFTRFDASKIEQANDAISRAKALFVGAGRTLAIQLAPFVTAVTNRFIEAGTAGEGIGPKVVSAFESVAHGIAFVGDMVQALKFGYKTLEITAVRALNAIGVASDDTLRRTEEAFNDFLLEDLPTEKVEKFFRKVKREAARAAKDAASSLKKIDTAPDETGIPTVADAIAADPFAGAGSAASGPRQLAANEIRSLRSINPFAGRSGEPIKKVERNTKQSLAEEKKHTSLLGKIVDAVQDSPSFELVTI